MEDGKIPIRKKEKINTISGGSPGMPQNPCPLQYPNMNEQGTEQPALTGAALSRSLDWKPPSVFPNQCIPAPF